VLQALGGDHAVAALTGADYKNVEGWRRAERFPSRYFLVMAFALHKKRLSAPPELWGQVTPAERKEALTALIGLQKRKVAA
jgi:hypothetical protein